MRVATKTITVVRTEMSEGEWTTLRHLVAEGLTVVEAVTPVMQGVAEALRLNVASPEASAPPKKPRKGIAAKAALPTGGDP